MIQTNTRIAVSRKYLKKDKPLLYLTKYFILLQYIFVCSTHVFQQDNLFSKEMTLNL